MRCAFSFSWKPFLPMLVAGLTVACTSPLPLEMQTPPPGNPQLPVIRAEPDCCIGQQVRWGGVILSTENLEGSTRVTILAMPLSDSGKPIISDAAQGRFIAEFDHFLEPALFPKNTRITISGIYQKTETKLVDKYPYAYPVIQVKHYYRWQEEIPVDEYYDPWYPWYPWSLYPYPYPYPLRHPYHHIH